MQEFIFASDQLPPELSDRARFSLWRDLYTSRYGRLDLSRPDDRPFSVRCGIAQFGAVTYARFEGTVNRVARTASDIASDASDDFCLLSNRGPSWISCSTRAREAALPPGAATLFSDTEAGQMCGEDWNAWFALVLPRRQLVELVRDAEDLTARVIDPCRPAVRHLRRYLGILFAPDDLGDDPTLVDHVGATLLDLVALAVGTGRDAAELVRMRGLRAARVRTILAEIKAGFADPEFTVEAVALRLGLTPRYLQDLLQETGLGFTARVIELRLQRARAMLADRHHDGLRIGEIAYRCGFNEFAHFSRCFRRRFGASPKQYRGGSV